MVVFTCNACGDSLKKNQVEKHYYTKCRSCNMLTCIDCNKDFWGDDYKEHIKCVTEAERYGGKDFKAPVFKGEAKQQEWIDLLSSIITTHDVSPRVRDVFQKMQSFNNVPRKEKPFKNFLQSSMGVRNLNLAQELWQTIQKAQQSAQKPPLENKGKQHSRVNVTDKDAVEDEKQQPQDDDVSQEGTEDEEPQGGVTKMQRPDNTTSQGATHDKTRSLKQPKKRPKGVSSQETAEDEESQAKKAWEDFAGQGEELQRPKKLKPNGVVSQESEQKKHRRDSAVSQGTTEEEENTAKKPKHQEENERDVTEEADGEQELVKKTKFKWKKAVKTALLEADGYQHSMKRLKKRVFSEFRSQGGHLSKEDMQAKFDKVLANTRYFEHEDGNVRLVHF